jgi:hypothetical protein
MRARGGELPAFRHALPKLGIPRDDRDPSRLVLGEHLSSARLSVAVAGVHDGQRLPLGSPDNVAGSLTGM